MTADKRILNAEEAAAYVDAASLEAFKREVAAGRWPKPHPKTHGRRSPGWDRHLLDALLDEGSGLSNAHAIDIQREQLRRGLQRGKNGSP